jgi:hypothetical protein
MASDSRTELVSFLALVKTALIIPTTNFIVLA